MGGISAFELAKQFLFGYGTLFAIINPFGLAFVFLNRTIGLSDADRISVARRVAVFAFAVLLVSLFAGAAILRFFGISLPALRIGGGLVVAASGWAMLNEPPREADAGHATSIAGIAAMRQMAFFPLTIPLTTGPGTIATAIALGANRPAELSGFLLTSGVSVAVAAAVALTIMVAYGRSATFARIVGRAGTDIVTRLSAFLLLCVGVQIALTGVLDALRLLAPVQG
ncbi:MarC family protein [Sabulicella rubraurantiaca]|uniref:MarC family protein n=1 Tax=Sabulicella rubraurantiaca TaxID=2811429 RepID=UPI001A96D9CA|nr:MarC family protein [Sabulicella rubraurantiaca]